MPKKTTPTGYCDPGLIRACREGLQQTVDEFIDAGIDLSACDENGLHALQHAAGCGKIEIVKLLLDKGDMHPDTTGRSDLTTALHSAIKYGYLAVVQLLVRRGASCDIKTRGGENTLVLAQKNLQSSPEPKKKYYQEIIKILQNPAQFLAQPAQVMPQPRKPVMEYRSIQANPLAGAASKPNPMPPISPAPLAPSTKKSVVFSQRPLDPARLPEDLAEYKAQIRWDRAPDPAETKGLLLQNFWQHPKHENLLKKYKLNEFQLALIIIQNNPDCLKEIFSHDYLGKHYEQLPLHYACFCGHDDIVAAILMYVENEELHTTDNHGNSILHLAACCGTAKIVTWALNRGLDPKQENNSGNNALQEVAAKEPLETREIIAALLNSKKISIDYRSKQGYTALHSAAKYGKEHAAAALLQWNADPRLESWQGTTSLACAKEQLEIAKSKGQTYQHAAVITLLESENTQEKYYARLKQAKRTGTLVDAFVNAAARGEIYNLRYIHGIFSEIMSNIVIDGCCSLLHAASGSMIALEVLDLLKSFCAPTHFQQLVMLPDLEYQQTPLQYAVELDRNDVVEWLLAEGADPTQGDERGLTVLHETAGRNRVVIMEIFLRTHWTDCLRVVTPRGLTLLHSAAKYGHLNMVQLLLRAGAVCTETALGHTVLDIALLNCDKDYVRRGMHVELIDFLLLRREKISPSITWRHVLRQDVRDVLKKYAITLRDESVVAAGPRHTSAQSLRTISTPTSPTRLDTRAEAQDGQKPSELLQFLLQVKQQVPVHSKQSCTAGSNPKAIYADSANTLRWVGKMGYDPIAEDDARAQTMRSSRTRTEKGISLDAIQEKIAMDFYKVFTFFQESSAPALSKTYLVPNTTLDVLPVFDANILQYPPYQHKVSLSFKPREGVEKRDIKTIFVMSDFIQNFHPLSDAEIQPGKPFGKAWCRQGKEKIYEPLDGGFPETLVCEGTAVSTDPLMQLLAHAKVIGDMDVFGPALSNVGWVRTNSGIRWVKLDGTHAFKGSTKVDYAVQAFISEEEHDARNLQLSALDEPQPTLVVHWQALSAHQKKIFCQALKNSLEICARVPFIEFMFYRNDLFEEQFQLSRDLLNDSNIHVKWQQKWLSKQRTYFAAELGVVMATSWLEKLAEHLGTYLQQNAESPAFLANATFSTESPKQAKATMAAAGARPQSYLQSVMTSAKVETAQHTTPEPLAELRFFQPAPNATPQEAIGKTTRVRDQVMNRFKFLFETERTYHSWDDEKFLFSVVLELTNGNKDFAFKICGSFLDHVSLLRDLLKTKGVAEEEFHRLSHQYTSEQDAGITTVLHAYGHLLNKNKFDEYQRFRIAWRLISFCRHSPNVSDILPTPRVEHPLPTMQPSDVGSKSALVDRGLAATPVQTLERQMTPKPAEQEHLQAGELIAKLCHELQQERQEKRHYHDQIQALTLQIQNLNQTVQQQMGVILTLSARMPLAYPGPQLPHAPGSPAPVLVPQPTHPAAPSTLFPSTAWNGARPNSQPRWQQGDEQGGGRFRQH